MSTTTQPVESRGRSGAGPVLPRSAARSVSPMMRSLPPAKQLQRDSISANQPKKRARKIRFFRNGDAFYKVRRSVFLLFCSVQATWARVKFFGRYSVDVHNWQPFLPF